jgi:NADP-dependent 3-hydroxy acid dehydrogenase YdfG
MDEPKKTVFITGASSGIGLQAALYFFEQRWNVIATMRNPDKRNTLLHEKELPDLVHLDVMDGKSIVSAIQYAVSKYQTVDVLVNNAGYAVYGPFEATTVEQIKRQFDTNVFGLMEVTRAFLPVFREQNKGVLINVSSMGGRLGFPLYSVYNSTKWAVEGFTEALQYELKLHNIKVRLIEPGVIKTDFYDRSLEKTDTNILSKDYGGILKRGQKRMNEEGLKSATEPREVARVIYRAAIDSGRRLRYPVGADALQVRFLRWLLPERWFYWLLEKFTLD